MQNLPVEDIDYFWFNEYYSYSFHEGLPYRMREELYKMRYDHYMKSSVERALTDPVDPRDYSFPLEEIK